MTDSRHVRLGLLLALPAVALTACGGTGSTAATSAGDGTGTITIWAHQGQDSENTVLQNAVNSFNGSQSAIKATLKFVPEKDYTKTLTATSASALPDIVEFDGPMMSSFVYNKKLSPISDYVLPATVDNATAAVKAQGTLDGKLYGLGMYDSGLGIYANKKLLDAAGVKYPTSVLDDWTAADFTAAVQKLAAANPGHKALDLKEDYGLATEWGTYGMSPIVWSAGGALVKQGKAAGALDSPAVVDAFRTFQSWKPYVDADTDGNAFVNGRVALSWVGHWAYPAYSKALGSDLTVLPLPDFGNGAKTGQGSWAWGISSGSQHAKAAGKFLDYLLDDTNVTAMTTADGAVPATKTALAASPLYRTGGPLHLFAQELAEPCGDTDITKSCVAVTRPLTAGYPVITAQFSQALNDIYGGADPQTSLAKAARAIDQDFSDNDGYSLTK
ncbi:extracellular solute-binding protein [Kitasatospora aureofaciens]|uniref:extracellular solute-binding protein n=1 Tax=Kitasatospora aureofaciens TaxID=1894 RepID=UPI0037C61C55